MNSNVDVSIIMPCWGRPLGTRKMIADICAQTVSGWELNLVGDCCKDFEDLINDNEFLKECNRQELLGNKINYLNLDKHHGGSGYQAINEAIKMASRNYTIFVANDDRISPLHLHNYFSPIYQTDFDMIMFETIIKGEIIRKPELGLGKVGHSEIILKTEALKQVPPHSPVYGHDWNLIVSLVNNGAKIGRDNRNLRTYYVQRLREDPDCG